MLLKLTSNFSTKKSGFFWTKVNEKVVTAQYAVRGQVPTLATEMKNQINSGKANYPFDKITFCNIGNPQEFRQKPISFNRQVISCVLNPSLIGNSAINPDASKRADRYLQQIISAGSYTHSLGIPSVRRSIANYIALEDGVQAPTVDQTFLTEGASQGVHMLMSTIITCPDDSIMIPVPQYPLYSAAIALYGGHLSPYYLNEEKGWQLDMDELERSYNESKKAGKNVKAMVIINPGNPTGAIFTAETIQKIIDFCVRNKIVLVTDEVYRENIYKKGAVFVSARKVLNTMSQHHKDQCELASLHTVSKGLLGECGLRGGYMNLYNFNPDVYAQLVKLKSINLCSNTVGQMMVDLMVNPPVRDVSENTKQTYLKEYNALFESMKKRAGFVTKFLKEMKNIECNEVEGAMYAFPKINFSKKAIEAAGNQAPDLFYCLEVLKNTGIALVPGSGFKQKPGTHHFRITTLILPEEELRDRLEDLKKFNESFHNKYQ